MKRAFKRTYFIPLDLVVYLSADEEQQIEENLREEGIDESHRGFKHLKEMDITDLLEDKFFELEKNHMLKLELLSDDIEEV